MYETTIQPRTEAPQPQGHAKAPQFNALPA